MLKLEKLKFSGIGRFVSEQEILFDDNKPIIQIDAKNMNTGGSSGSGKTTIFHAIDYLFGVNDRSASQLQSRISGEGIFVSGEFSSENGKIYIERSKKGGLVVDNNGKVVKGNSKIAEEEIDKIIGIDRKLFKRMFHKKQKEGGFFLNLTAKESYDFLMSVLSLKEWESNVAKIDESIKESETSLSDMQIEEKLAIQNLENIKSNIFELESRQIGKSFNESFIASAKDKIKEIQDRIDILKDKIQDEIGQIPLPDLRDIPIFDDFVNKIKELEFQLSLKINEMNTVKNEHQAKILQIEGLLTSLNDKKNNINISKSNLAYLKSEVQSLIDSKDKMSHHKCPTCDQVWIGDGATSRRSEIEKLILNKTEKINGLFELVSQEPDIIEKIVRLSAIKSQYINENPCEPLELDRKRIEEAIANEKNRLNEIKNNISKDNEMARIKYDKQKMQIEFKHHVEITELESQRNEMMADFSLNMSNKKRYEEELAEKNKNLEKMQQLLFSKSLELQTIKDEISSIENKIRVMEESKRLIKSYNMKIFQDTLDYIGELSSQILSRIPAMANASIFFDSSRETKSGSVREEVNAVVNLDGENAIPIKTLSGGEETAIELAVDLAVIEMIEERAGKGLNLFILDEPFNGLDSQNSERILEMLLNYRANKTILIVDHNPIVKEMVGNVITVIRDGEKSNIQ